MSDPAELDPIALAVALGGLRAACEEMGALLVRAAHSPNIKERRDASCAVFDPAGQMIMQAEHIPVHLGAMPAAVAAVLDGPHAPGRSFILNDPFSGGTHLPDITLVTPAYLDDQLIGFAATRAHHADVGGRLPGSMPADSRTLAEEGVLIEPQPLQKNTIESLISRMRQPAERRADLRAQQAANELGARRLAELARRIGVDGLARAAAEVIAYAERRTRACIARLADGERRAVDLLEAPDGDLELRLLASIDGDRLVLDFTGSADQHPGNLNCPLAVTHSACYYAARVLTDPDIPPSAGAHRPIEVIAPLGSILNARRPAAVAAGNVETSSRVADLVLAAFGWALGQGTMNNLTLGNDRFSYYETIGGGQGACPDADGPSGIHVAMSNTLNTPVEALERAYPIRVVRSELRRRSGGRGAHQGGDGIIRELEALEPMTYSLIAERRRHPPPGAAGGQPGRPGRDLLNGAVIPGKSTGTLQAGDRLRIETPGGGGHGRPMSASTPLPRIGFIGLGIMGSRMAANLAAAGFPLTVWNRTRATAERFAAAHGPACRLADSPADLAGVSEIVVTMVVDADQVESVLLGPDGVAAGGQPGLLCIDCSTIGPAATLRIAAGLDSHGIRLIDAPVTGSAPRAADATLTIMAGGTAEDFALGRPALDAIGRLVLHVGPLGHGQTIKLINNSVAAANALTVAEALLVGGQAGVDLDCLVAVMEAGSGSSTMLSLKAAPMRSHDFAPLFKLAHMLKDVRLCLEAAGAAGVRFGAAEAAEAALREADQIGLGADDFAALLVAVEKRSGQTL